MINNYNLGAQESGSPDQIPSCICLFLHSDKPCPPLRSVPHLQPPQPSAHTCGSVLVFRCDPGKCLSVCLSILLCGTISVSFSSVVAVGSIYSILWCVRPILSLWLYLCFAYFHSLGWGNRLGKAHKTQ